MCPEDTGIRSNNSNKLQRQLSTHEHFKSINTRHIGTLQTYSQKKHLQKFQSKQVTARRLAQYTTIYTIYTTYTQSSK